MNNLFYMNIRKIIKIIIIFIGLNIDLIEIMVYCIYLYRIMWFWLCTLRLFHFLFYLQALIGFNVYNVIKFIMLIRYFAVRFHYENTFHLVLLKYVSAVQV